MEFTGRIKKVLPLRSGVSQRTGNEWKSQSFIFEYFEHPTDRFPDTVVLETFDEKIISELKENQPVRIGFGHHSREYEGKQFNELRMYKFEALTSAEKPADAPADAQSNNNPQPQQQAATGGDNADDLPF